MGSGDFITDNGTRHPVDVGDRQLGCYRFAPFYGWLADIQQSGHVQRFVQAVVLGLNTVVDRTNPHVRRVEDVGKVKSLGLPVGDRLSGLQQMSLARQEEEIE